MKHSRSFQEYVCDGFYNELFSTISLYVENNSERLDLHSYVVNDVENAFLSDIYS